MYKYELHCHTHGVSRCGGIETLRPIRSNAELLDVLRSGSYTLLRPEGGDRHAAHKAG